MSILNVNQINSIAGVNTVTFQSDSVFNSSVSFNSGVNVGEIKNTSGINTSTPDEIYNGRLAAWAKFDGFTDGIVTIKNTYNVSSVNDIAVGQYTVNFTSALPTSNFAAVANAGNNPSTVNVRDFNTTSVRLDVHDSSGVDADRSIVCVLISNL